MALPVSTPKFSPISTPVERHLTLVPPPAAVAPAESVVHRPRWVLVVLIAITSLVGSWSLGSSSVESLTSGFSVDTTFDAELVSTTLQTEYYQVRSGDTLWTIAHHVAADQDVRQVVDDLRTLNGGDVVLQPGEILVLPVYAEGS